MIVIFLVLLMVNSVFGVVIANALVNTPTAVFPTWSAIVVALIIGQLVHRNFNLIVLSIAGVVALYLSVYAGSVLPLELPAFFGLTANANWILILFLYAAIASMLPVWMLLQPEISSMACNLSLAFACFMEQCSCLCRIFLHPRSTVGWT